MSIEILVLIILAAAFVIWRLWQYLSGLSGFGQSAITRTEDANAGVATREVAIRNAIEQGYRSEKFAFLETIKPIDTLDEESMNDLPEDEQAILGFKRKWLATQYPAQLAAIIDLVIQDRKNSPITNVVTLGMGDNSMYSIQQFVVFSQIVAQLARAYPGLLRNIVMQDPSMTAERRALFENHGCQIVAHPAAFKLVGPNTLLYSPWCYTFPLLEGLKGQPFGNIAMFVGNGKELTRAIPNNGSHQELYRQVLDPMLDDGFCKVADVPCDKDKNSPTQHRIGPMCGLNGMDISWRPLSDTQKFTMRFEAAQNVGFEADYDEFKEAYDAGFATRYGDFEQRKIARGFMASRFLGSKQRFVDYFRSWAAGKLSNDEKYDIQFKRWSSFDKDPFYQDQTRSWHEYLKGNDKYEFNDESGRHPAMTYPPRDR